jgi:hypothetical protein
VEPLFAFLAALLWCQRMPTKWFQWF